MYKLTGLTKSIIVIGVLSLFFLSITLDNHIITPLHAENNFLNIENEILQDSLKILIGKLQFYQQPNIIENITATVYHPVKEQTDDTPHILADGTHFVIEKASEYRYIGISRDLLKHNGGLLNLGDWVYIKGIDDLDGIYQVRDKMNKRWKKRIDILKSPGEPGFKYENVIMIKLNIPKI